MVHTGNINLATRGHADMHDLTKAVEDIVESSRVRSGLITIFAPSATSAITTIEFESGALEDLRNALDEIAPQDRSYQHNLRWGDGNGHSHLRSALMKTSFSIPIVDGRMTLGTWQQILYIDFDVRPRQRSLVVQIIGD